MNEGSWRIVLDALRDPRLLVGRLHHGGPDLLPERPAGEKPAPSMGPGDRRARPRRHCPGGRRAALLHGVPRRCAEYLARHACAPMPYMMAEGVPIHPRQIGRLPHREAAPALLGVGRKSAFGVLARRPAMISKRCDACMVRTAAFGMHCSSQPNSLCRLIRPKPLRPPDPDEVRACRRHPRIAPGPDPLRRCPSGDLPGERPGRRDNPDPACPSEPHRRSPRTLKAGHTPAPPPVSAAVGRGSPRHSPCAGRGPRDHTGSLIRQHYRM